MISIAIVDDEENTRKYLVKNITDAFKRKNCSVDCEIFSSGASFINTYKMHHHFNIIFMDIEMSDTDGFTASRTIKNITPEAIIVFVSNRDDLVFDAFEMAPFRFIRKDEFEAKLPSLTDSLVLELERRTPQIIKLREPKSGDIFSFDIRNIYYIEAQGHSCRIICVDGETLIKCKLSSLEEQLAPWHFVKPHRSYLVNCKYIFRISKFDITLSDKSTIPISRGRAEEIKQIFLSYTSEVL